MKLIVFLCLVSLCLVAAKKGEKMAELPKIEGLNDHSMNGKGPSTELPMNMKGAAPAPKAHSGAMHKAPAAGDDDDAMHSHAHHSAKHSNKHAGQDEDSFIEEEVPANDEDAFLAFPHMSMHPKKHGGKGGEEGEDTPSPKGGHQMKKSRKHSPKKHAPKKHSRSHKKHAAATKHHGRRPSHHTAHHARRPKSHHARRPKSHHARRPSHHARRSHGRRGDEEERHGDEGKHGKHGSKHGKHGSKHGKHGGHKKHERKYASKKHLLKKHSSKKHSSKKHGGHRKKKNDLFDFKI
jgi:hypothetical protein